MLRVECRRVLTAGVVLVGLGFMQASDCGAQDVRLLVPAYGNPFDAQGLAMWQALTDTATVVGPSLLVILNPNSGPGASPIDPNYVGPDGQGPFIDFRNAGGVAIGYVKTLWAGRPLADAQQDVDRYYDAAYWRGAGVQIDGIFFDEMSNELQDVGYYEALRDYVRALDASAHVIGNPGTSFVDTTTPSGWSISDYAESVDTLVTFESDYSTYLGNYSPPSWLASYPAERFAHIVYGVTAAQMASTLDLARQRKAGYVYLTDDSGANPYDVLATYWTSEVDNARSVVFRDGFESGSTGAWSP